jgi:hypothetical protein
MGLGLVDLGAAGVHERIYYRMAAAAAAVCNPLRAQPDQPQEENGR